MGYKLENIQGRTKLVICLFLFVLVLVLMPQMVWAQILDPLFNPNANSDVYAITNQANGKIIISGAFTTMGGVTRNRIARLNPDGTLDTAFNPDTNNIVGSIAIQSDGKIIIGGDFTAIGGVTRNRIARLNPYGTLDTTFNPNANGRVIAISIQADGRIIIGGEFTQIGGVARNRIARLNSDGTLDTTFNPNANSIVGSIAIQSDGRIIIGGLFTRIGGVTRNRIARLHANGTLDTTFNPNANNWVFPLSIQADGRIIIGGVFTRIGGVTRNRIARLHANGTLDTTFNPNANSGVYAITIQADGRIILGGEFTQIGGVSRNRIARLHANGTLDHTFNPNANDWVSAITIQADGNIIVGGLFTQIGGVTRNRIARITGVLDTNFAHSSDTTLYAYENIDGKAGRPTVGWLSDYHGASGVASFGFGNLNQGVKMTLNPQNFISSVSSKWYLLEARVMTNSPVENDKSVNLFLFNGIPPNPFDVAAHAIPFNLSTTWSWMRIYLQSVGGLAQMYPQLIIQNNGHAGNIYIDTIRITQQAPPTIPTVFYAGGDWDNSDDINYWAIERGFDLPNLASYNVNLSDGVLMINFDGLSPQGLKMTMSTTAGLTVTAPTNIGRAGGMSTQIANMGLLSDALILLAAFGTNQSGGGSIEEIAASASYQRIPPRENGLYRVVYYPTQPYIYGQVMVKNSAAGIIFMNDTYLLVEPNIALVNKADYWELVRK